VKLKRRPRQGPSRFWAFALRMRFVRFHMPFWRVIIEARPAKPRRNWPANADIAVTAVFVWARTMEEAEGLAMLALEEEGLTALTADAVKALPAARPRKSPIAVARTDLGYLPRYHTDEPTPSLPPRRASLR